MLVLFSLLSKCKTWFYTHIKVWAYHWAVVLNLGDGFSFKASANSIKAYREAVLETGKMVDKEERLGLYPDTIPPTSTLTVSAFRSFACQIGAIVVYEMLRFVVGLHRSFKCFLVAVPTDYISMVRSSANMCNNVISSATVVGTMFVSFEVRFRLTLYPVIPSFFLPCLSLQYVKQWTHLKRQDYNHRI